MNKPRCKATFHIRNGSAYDRALVQRGSLTVWISEEALATWGQFDYGNQAIEAVLTLKEVFHLTNREAEGLVRSVFALMQVALAVPDHSTLFAHDVFAPQLVEVGRQRVFTLITRARQHFNRELAANHGGDLDQRLRIG